MRQGCLLVLGNTGSSQGVSVEVSWWRGKWLKAAKCLRTKTRAVCALQRTGWRLWEMQPHQVIVSVAVLQNCWTECNLIILTYCSERMSSEAIVIFACLGLDVYLKLLLLLEYNTEESVLQLSC